MAVALMIGFYLFALLVAGTLLYVPYAAVAYLGTINLLTIFSAIGGLVILWSIIPHPDTFEAPGPELRPHDHPRLFELIGEVAAATEQEMPAEVYLVYDFNAWVTNRGGVMGFGSRRVMGLGLPLLNVLSIPELKGVLAHEFGHYHYGDTRLGPWVYKTRNAIERTLKNLASHNSNLYKLFRWYGLMFLRVSHSVSRQQEFTADALATRVVGPELVTAALKKSHAHTPAFYTYWNNEVTPALASGYRPPIAAGFKLFAASPRVAAALDEYLRIGLQRSEPSDPYDTHPTLSERLSALEGGQAVETDLKKGTTSALTLLDDVEQLEASLIAMLVIPDLARRIQPLKWEEMGEKVWIEEWKRTIEMHRDELRTMPVEALPASAAELEQAVSTLGVTSDVRLPPDERAQATLVVLGAALGATLAREGWSYVATPGDPHIFEYRAQRIDPFDTVTRLARQELPREEWTALCAATGLSGARLAQ